MQFIKKSKITQALTYSIIAPAILLSVMSFSTETSSTLENTHQLTSSFNESEVIVIISKEDTDAQLDALIKTFGTQNVIMIIKNVKRNDSNEIISISIHAKTDSSTFKYNKDSNTPILPIRISFDTNSNNLQISESKPESHMFIVRTNDTSDAENTTIRIKSVNSDTESIVLLNKDHKIISLTTNGETTQLDTNGDVIAWSEEHKPKDINKKEEALPLVFVDGKKITRLELDNIDPNSIEKMNVWKGEKAIEKYGEDAKDGVIEVTLKKS